MDKLKWSVLFKTHVALIDEQHQKLFSMINDIAETLNSGKINQRKVESALNGLVDYSHQHFADEEQIMLDKKVDERHQRFQKMEHSSFIYDLTKLRNYSFDENLEYEYEKVLKFAASWLIYHTLRTDQKLATQIHAIEDGSTPEEAYEYAESHPLNPALYKEILDALLMLWTDSLVRIKELEAQINEDKLSV